VCHIFIIVNTVDQRTAASKLKKILKDMEAKKATLYSVRFSYTSVFEKV